MKERPILFSGAMVRAILEGRKTVTRRMIKPSMRSADTQFELHQEQDGSWRPMHTFDESSMDHLGTEHPIVCPYGQAGDRLWVRETFADLQGTGIEHRPDPRGPLQRYAFAADSPPGSAGDEARKDFGIKWKPSIHMPRAVCRILLEITGLRVERLQSISEEQALAEGVTPSGAGTPEGMEARFAFRDVWFDINGAESWEANPWVWVVEFKRIEA